MPQVTPGRRDALDHLLRVCGGLRAGESVAIASDDRTHDLATTLAERARQAGAAAVEVIRIAAAAMHGQEPPVSVAKAFSGAALAIGLTTASLAHTEARRAACAAGARYLSLPDYSWELLDDPAVRADYHARAPLVRRFADAFTAGSSVRVTSAAGTDIQLDIRGRTGNFCPGYVAGPGTLGSPPDIEANVSPVETASEGVVVVDGSVPCSEVGLLGSPLRLEVAGGRIVDVTGADTGTVATVRGLFERVGSGKAYVLAECGVGLNDQARLTGAMLTDEGAFGCVHFGFGSNSTVGGINAVPFHLDFVFRRASLAIDGIPFLVDGELAP